MYNWERWIFLNSIETECKYAGKYGAKGEKRAKRKKPTPEQVAKQNQINKENRIRRLIKANFYPSDLWVTLKYPKGTRKPFEEVRKDMNSFLRKLRYRYRKIGNELKYIYRIEIGKRGGIHVHILVNRTSCLKGTDVLITECWTEGFTHFTPIREAGGYKDLAEYIAKPVPEEQKEHEAAEQAKAYHPSRNLIKPKPERKTFFRWTMRKLLEDGPKPTPGFYIVKESIVSGINKFTGMSYLRYTEQRIKEVKRE